MRSFLLWAVMFSICSVALALEGQHADIGDSCRHAIQIETNLGDRPAYDVERMLPRHLLLFEASAEAGQREQILYRCSDSDETVVGYSKKLTSPNEPLAWSTYAREREAMKARFGAPPIDSETFGLPQRIRLWRAYSSVFSANEFCQWQTASGQNVSVKIQKLRESEQWQVVTTDMPPLGNEVEGSRNRLLRLLARALVVAFSSAALVAALAMTRLHPFRWLMALVVPLALAYESLWALPWNPVTSPESIGWNALAVAIGSLFGAMTSCLLIWRLGGQLAPRNVPTGASSQAAKPLLCFGLILFAALLTWSWWQFRPGNDPGNLAGGFTLKLLLPAAVALIGTVLTVLGTIRMPSVLAPANDKIRTPDFGFAVIGVLASIVAVTLWITVAAEIALAL